MRKYIYITVFFGKRKIVDKTPILVGKDMNILVYAEELVDNLRHEEGKVVADRKDCYYEIYLNKEN